MPRKKKEEIIEVEETIEVEEKTAEEKEEIQVEKTKENPKEKTRDFLSLNDNEKGVSIEDTEDAKWNYLSGAMREGSLLTGTVSGVEKTSDGEKICIIDYVGLRIVIPEKEMFLDKLFEGNEARQESRLNRMLGSSVDFILIGMDFKNRAAIGSRKIAMKALQNRYYKSSQIREGDRVGCRILEVGGGSVVCEAFGCETRVRSSELSWAWHMDTSEIFSPGDITVGVVEKIEYDEEKQIYHIEVSFKKAEKNPDLACLQSLNPQGTYFATVTGTIDKVIFLRLKVGANAKTMTYRSGKMPQKGDEVSFVVRSVDTEKGMAFGMITRIIKSRDKMWQ